MKKLLLIFFPIIALVTSCGNNGSISSGQSYNSSATYSETISSFSMISPSGAPSLSLYKYALNGQLEINTSAQNVGAQLQNNMYDIVTFDFYNGLKSIKNKNGNYKLAKILTGGNLYLVGLNKSENEKEPKNGDYIVSFGQNLIPDLVFKKIYGNVLSNIHYVNSNSDVVPILLSGLHSGTKVDYVLIAEPGLTTALGKINEDFKYTKVCLRDKWGEVMNTEPIIPQAGLFINNDSYSANKNAYSELLNNISIDNDKLISSPEIFKQEVEKYGKEDDVLSLFSFTIDTVINVQKDGNNGFGLLPQGKDVDINGFLHLLDINEDYREFII